MAQNTNIDAAATAEALREHERQTARKESVLDQLAAYADKTINNESPILRHQDPANKISLPGSMTPTKGAKTLMEYEANQQKKTVYMKQYNARVEDGAVALTRIFNRVYGSTGIGNTRFDMFGGEHPPVKTPVVVGLDQFGREITENVLMTEFDFEPLDATIEVGVWANAEMTGLFVLNITSLVKNQAAIDGLFLMVEDELRTNSIYKGKVLSYEADNRGSFTLKHVSRQLDPTIVYTDEVKERLTDDVFGLITDHDLLVANGMDTTFKALVWGPLGTGKSAATIATSVLAQQYGVTTIEFKPTGADSLNELIRVVNVAKMYSRSIVIIEDFDKFFDEKMTAARRSTLTNLFDGADKRSEVSFVLTTNFIERIDPAMTRAQRLTSQIEIGFLDRAAIELMLQKVLGDQLDTDIDYDAVWAEVKDYGPAFIRSTFEKARQVSLTRNHQAGIKLSTSDLVSAARSKKAQNDLHTAMSATKVEDEPTVESVLVKALLQGPEFRKAVVATLSEDVNIDVSSYFGGGTTWPLQVRPGR